MSASRVQAQHRPRELRRRVVIPARMRTGAQWSDACILNISSRGLMIQAARSIVEGSVVELRRGDHVIVAQVMWRSGARAGLQSRERLAVEEIMSVSQSKALQLVAADGARIERRLRPRTGTADARLRGRAFEFVGVGVIVVALAISAWAMAVAAFAKPFASIEAALVS